MFLPLVHRMDLGVTQDVFSNISGKRNAGQFRIDIQNAGNLLNSDWGVGQRVIRNNILTTPAADASGARATACRSSTTSWFEVLRTEERPDDVYQFMLSFRYSFN